MGVASLSESTVEALALDWLASQGWFTLHGPDIAPDMPAAERAEYGVVVLAHRLRSALARLNPDLSDDALEEEIISGSADRLPELDQAGPLVVNGP